MYNAKLRQYQRSQATIATPLGADRLVAESLLWSNASD
jgi:hypothetical protein